jgi:hypothetical protein
MHVQFRTLSPRIKLIVVSISLLLLVSTAVADSGAYRSLTVNGPQIPVESPFTIDLTAGSNVTTFTSCIVYLDNVKYHQVSGATMKVNISAPVGPHRITVQCYDQSDNWTKQIFYVQVVALQSGGRSVGLSWNASTGASGYNLYRSTNGTSYSKQNINLLATRGYTDDAVSSGATYWYYVTAVNSSGQESPPSNTARAVIP